MMLFWNEMVMCTTLTLAHQAETGTSFSDKYTGILTKAPYYTCLKLLMSWLVLAINKHPTITKNRETRNKQKNQSLRYRIGSYLSLLTSVFFFFMRTTNFWFDTNLNQSARIISIKKNDNFSSSAAFSGSELRYIINLANCHENLLLETVDEVGELLA